MDVRDVELIRAVHEEGSLSKACLRLNVSQPTLSKKLARLEHVLGSTLFHRNPKGLLATDTAKYIVTKSQALRSQVAEIERHVELMNQLETGELRLGVGPIIEQTMLPEVLEAFTEKTGDVQLSIVTADEDVLLAMFEASELDVVVGPFLADERVSDNVMALPMIEDEIIAVVRAKHPLLKTKLTDLDQLMAHSWVAPRAQGTTKQLGDHPVLSRMKIHSDNYHLLKQITMRSDVICAGPSAVFIQEFYEGSLVALSVPPVVTWKSALLVRPETYATPLGKHLVSLFESARARNSSTHHAQANPNH